MRPTVTRELTGAPKTTAMATMEKEAALAVVAKNWRRGTAGEAVLADGIDVRGWTAFMALGSGRGGPWSVVSGPKSYPPHSWRGQL